MQPAGDGHGTPKADAFGDIGAHGSEDVEGRAQRGHQAVPAHTAHQAREPPPLRRPEIGVAAQGCGLGGGYAGEAPRPELRIRHEIGRARERLGEAAGLPEELRAEIEPSGQAWGVALRESRSNPGVLRIEGVGAIVLVVEDRQDEAVRPDQRARRTVGGDRHGVDPDGGRRIGEGVAQEGFDRRDIRVGVATIPQNHVRGRPNPDLVPLRRIDDDQLDVGLPDIDHRDPAGGRRRRPSGRHGRWNSVWSGRTTGASDGSVSMRSAMWAHQRRITGWSGRLSMS